MDAWVLSDGYTVFSCICAREKRRGLDKAWIYCQHHQHISLLFRRTLWGNVDVLRFAIQGPLCGLICPPTMNLPRFSHGQLAQNCLVSVRSICCSLLCSFRSVGSVFAATCSVIEWFMHAWLGVDISLLWLDAASKNDITSLLLLVNPWNVLPIQIVTLPLLGVDMIECCLHYIITFRGFFVFLCWPCFFFSLILFIHRRTGVAAVWFAYEFYFA